MSSLQGTKNSVGNLVGEVSAPNTLSGGVNMGAVQYRGIDSVQQTTTSEADNGINVVTMTLTDGTKTDFIIRNGSKGSQGVGITSVKQTVVSEADDGDNYVVFGLSDGTEHAIKVQNGSKGSTGDAFTYEQFTEEQLAGLKGDKGDKGDTGAKGSDGVSATHSWNGTVLSITSASGTSSADLKGAKGDKGDTGAKGSDASVTSTNIKNALGYTPAKSEDVSKLTEQIVDHKEDTTIHVTSAEKTTWNNKSDFSGSYNDLTNKPTIPTVPTSLKNPYKLTISLGSSSYTYDGSKAINITIEDGSEVIY